MIHFSHRRSFTLLASGLVLTLLPLAHSHAASSSTNTVKKNVPDAFLPVQARSVEAIVAQVQADPVVRRHYARYLHLPEARVASYLRANLVPSHLGHDGMYTVYYVRPNGLIYPTLLKIAQGSPVFALRNGPALLTWNEGNPLIRSQRTVRYDPNRKPLPPVAVPASVPPTPPRVEQVIVPSKPETTVVPPPAAPAPEPSPAAGN